MCGIIAAFNQDKNKPVNDFVIAQYEEQFRRGQQGFGVVRIDDEGYVSVDRATEPVKALMDLTPKLEVNLASMIVFHHRQPTSTDNHLDQTHPLVVRDPSLKFDYLLVHNGIIQNAKELKQLHENELGFVYTTKYESGTIEKFNDSESLAIEVARFIEKQQGQINTSGSAAFICLQISKDKDKDMDAGKLKAIYFGKTEYADLNLSATRGKIRISSEGEGEEIKSEMLYSFTPDDFTFSKRAIRFVPLTSAAPAKSLPAYHKTDMGFKGKDIYPHHGRTSYPHGDDYHVYDDPREYGPYGKEGGFSREDDPTSTVQSDVIYGDEEMEEIIDDCTSAVTMELDFLFDKFRDNPQDSFKYDVESTVANIQQILKDAETKVDKINGERLVEAAKQSGAPIGDGTLIED